MKFGYQVSPASQSCEREAGYTLTDDLTIIGASADQTIINTIVTDRVFDISPGVTAHLEGVTITDGTTRGGLQGGGNIRNAGSLTVIDSVISNGISHEGGAVRNQGSLRIENSTLSQNRGTGLFVGSHRGGAIYNEVSAEFAIINSTLVGNSVSGSITSAAQGGGIFNRGTGTIENSTLSANETRFSGGAIFNAIGATLDITNSTITDNRATGTGGLGFGTGGGIITSSMGVTLNNTIVAGNLAASTPGDIEGTVNVANSNNNLIGDSGTAGGLTNGSNGNIVGVANPLLGPLQNNGGPAFTHTLLPGSPAIDAGNNALAVDSTGNPLTTGVIRSTPRF